jgi:hypothetical protein
MKNSYAGGLVFGSSILVNYYCSITDCVGKYCKQLSNGLCNEQLAVGNLQLV